jgi:PAS domain-containing protein
MNAPALPDQDRGVVTAQLFRYAQDMEELMRQHNRLQRQQQMILQSLGKGANGPDLLPRLLMHASPMYWVTDAQGVVMHASSMPRGQFPQPMGTLVGKNVTQLIQAPGAIVLQSLQKRLAEQAYTANAVHCRVEMAGPVASLHGMVWNALLMQMQEDGRVDTSRCWRSFTQCSCALSRKPVRPCTNRTTYQPNVRCTR